MYKRSGSSLKESDVILPAKPECKTLCSVSRFYKASRLVCRLGVPAFKNSGSSLQKSRLKPQRVQLVCKSFKRSCSRVQGRVLAFKSLGSYLQESRLKVPKSWSAKASTDHVQVYKGAGLKLQKPKVG